MMFDKSPELFPVKKEYLFLAHSSVSPLFSSAAQREMDIARAQRDTGVLVAWDYGVILQQLKSSAAALLKTVPENLALVKNTSEGMGLIANGYSFKPGDRIISYVHEYPANHYPWKLQEGRGVVLDLLPDHEMNGTDCQGRPCGWSMTDLEQLVRPETRMVAVSHVQFAGGYAVDLKELGVFCRDREIDLVIDAAQSLGCLPVYPEEYHISAVVASGWKWLLGPIGTGLLYVSEAFREKLGHVMVGAETMVQGMDYLNHAWQPHSTAKRFEYSTQPLSLAAALETCIREVFLRYHPEQIRAEVYRLQDVFLTTLDRDTYSPVRFDEPHRSGILSLICGAEPELLEKKLLEKGLICSSRGGYLRVAPHFYNSDEEMVRAAELLNLCGE
ncbi:aminotransferase class V-fold PLP-dependent enzyme, partial [Thermodesulfobacteriota bacterium]